MSLLITIFIALGLAMDAFAVSLGVGSGGVARLALAPAPRPLISPQARRALRISFHFGLFQAGMTWLGWLAGASVERFIAAFDHWIAFALLAFVGGRMIASGLSFQADLCPRPTFLQRFTSLLQAPLNGDPSRGGILVMLCIATSIDALAVGLSLAMLGVAVLLPGLIIGLITFFLSLLGFVLGRQLGERFGKSMEIVGGLILLSIGLRILYTHLFL